MNTPLKTGKYAINSETVTDRQYTLIVTRKGKKVSASCSCPGYRRHKHCKHATAAQNGEYAS